jgi:hypothetical protein
MNILVVQKRLPYRPQCLGDQADAFLKEVRQLIRAAEIQHASCSLELSDIGFAPAGDYIEVKLYFREHALLSREK